MPDSRRYDAVLATPRTGRLRTPFSEFWIQLPHDRATAGSGKGNGAHGCLSAHYTAFVPDPDGHATEAVARLK